MSDTVYNWKRFWCPRSGSISLGDQGFLSDPHSEWGKSTNPDLVTFEAISHIPCLVLLGEPGIGKTEALKIKQDKVVDRLKKDGHQSRSLDLRSFSSEDRLIKKLFASSEFISSKNGDHQLHIFLDSLDECLLRIDTVATLLVDEFRSQQINPNNLFLRIACRTAVWPSVLEEGLKEIWGKESVGVYELAPLRQIDIRETAKEENFSADDFLQEIILKQVQSLAIKPVTLKFLVKTYRKHGSQFPSSQRLHELYHEGCEVLCEEPSQSRQDSGRRGYLDIEERLIVAARIAAITIYCNRFAVWKGLERGNVPVEDVTLRKLCSGSESANGREFEVKRETIEEVLDTGLFSSRGPDRMGWAHQTYAEFLAAWYLVKREVSLAQLRELFFSTEDPNRLIPQLHETAAWLASMNAEFLQEIVKTDPDVLLRTDIPTDATVRAGIVSSLLNNFEEGKLHNGYGGNYRNYSKLQHSGLAEQLQPFICDASKREDSRYFALSIIRACKTVELKEQLIDLILDSSQSIDLRESAANSINLFGDSESKLRLKPLIFNQLMEDKEDQLKGYLLQALWPEHLTAKELFQLLTYPKKIIFIGPYQRFLDDELIPKLKPEDLPIALKWIATKGILYSGNPLEKLGNKLVIEAWGNFDLPTVAECFIEVAFLQWKKGRSLVGYNEDLRQSFKLAISNHVQKRGALIEKFICFLSTTVDDQKYLISYLSQFVVSQDDILWLLEKCQAETAIRAQKLWAKLILMSYNHNEFSQIDSIISSASSNKVLGEIFSLRSIELESAEAQELKANYDLWNGPPRVRQKPVFLDPLPKIRILELLDGLESGGLSAWWQLNFEMTLEPQSTHPGDEYELDLTKLPGWEEAEDSTKNRIIQGAEKYIQEQNNVESHWIGTNTSDRSAVAGVRALVLLLKKNYNFLSNISQQVWKEWAIVIIGSPFHSNYETCYLEIVKYAYLNAPEESITTLMKLIDKENCIHNYLLVLNRFQLCWDQRLKLALFEKAKDPSLKPKCVDQLLQVLLNQGLREVKDFAKSLIIHPLPLDSNSRQKSLIGANLVFQSSDLTHWSFVFSIMEKDPSFGREFLELNASDYSDGIKLDLSESQLADLYLWLVKQYPYHEDRPLDGVVYDVMPRDHMTRFRNKILLQLEEKGTLLACKEIERIIQALPEPTGLTRVLIDARSNMRRKTWQPPKPEELLQLLTRKSPDPSQGVRTVTYNFDQRGANIGVNIAQGESNISFTQNIRQNTGLSESELNDIIQKIKDALQQVAQSDPITTELVTVEQKESFIQKAVQKLESIPSAFKVIAAAGLEGLKIYKPEIGIPIEILRSLYDIAKEHKQNS